MKKVIAAFLVLAAIVKTAAAYPIEPRPLRKLVMESEYIIVGHVLEIRLSKRKDNDFGPTSIAVIKVMEVLQGTIKGEIIEVSYHANLICPAPPRYRPETTVLAFLKKDNGKFFTHALSYGAKTLSLSDVAVYKIRIQEMQLIQTIADADKKFMETIEWLVKCTEHQATRWEGSFELSPESDFMSYYSRSELPPYKHLLSEDQKQRLKSALLDTHDSHYCDFGLVDLVYAANENEIRSFLLQGLKNLPDQQLWMADEYMKRLLYGKDSPEMEKLVDNFSELQFERGTDTKLKGIVSDFIMLAER